jgi:hypothetical protein
MTANPASRELLALVRQAAPPGGTGRDRRARQAAGEEASRKKPRDTGSFT